MFVDHYSDFTYFQLMSKLDAESTVEDNLVFERICDLCGLKALHYHVDNCLFDTKKFKGACNIAKQNLSFCGVNAHNQNIK